MWGLQSLLREASGPLPAGPSTLMLSLYPLLQARLTTPSSPKSRSPEDPAGSAPPRPPPLGRRFWGLHSRFQGKAAGPEPGGKGLLQTAGCGVLCKHGAINESPRHTRLILQQAAESPEPAVTMEAGALWLLVAVLAVGSSSSSAQYLGLCESCSDALRSAARGGRVGTARGGPREAGGLLWASGG